MDSLETRTDRGKIYPGKKGQVKQMEKRDPCFLSDGFEVFPLKFSGIP